jgi:hypothetical protein
MNDARPVHRAKIVQMSLTGLSGAGVSTFAWWYWGNPEEASALA